MPKRSINFITLAIFAPLVGVAGSLVPPQLSLMRLAAFRAVRLALPESF